MGAPPRTAYLVCATQRSGSTLLCETLRATGIAGQPYEHFEHLRHSGRPRQPREYFAGRLDPELESLLAPLEPRPEEPPAANEAPSDWWARILREGSTPNGVWGGKLMWDHVSDFAARGRRLPGLSGADLELLLDRLLGDVRLVYVTREDKVAQAVSLWRAVQTQAWRHDGAAEARPAEYRFAGIDHMVRLMEAHDDAWRSWFAAAGREPLRLVYEQLRTAPQEGVAQVLRALGLPVGELPAPALSRQRDATSREWGERYRAESADAARRDGAIA